MSNPKNTKKEKVVKAWARLDSDMDILEVRCSTDWFPQTILGWLKSWKGSEGIKIVPCTIHYKLTNKKK